MPLARALTAVLLLALALAACGDDDAPERPAEKADTPVDPPPGWRTVENEAAGFTIAAPKSWPAATKRGATLIRSKDELVAVTLAADRSDAGRNSEPAAYARDVVAALPGFEGAVSVKDPRIVGSPYETAIAVGSGTVKTSGVAQRIEVAVFHRPAQGELHGRDLPQRQGPAGARARHRGADAAQLQGAAAGWVMRTTTMAMSSRADAPFGLAALSSRSASSMAGSAPQDAARAPMSSGSSCRSGACASVTPSV